MHLAPGAQAAAVRLFDQSRGKGAAILDSRLGARGRGLSNRDTCRREILVGLAVMGAVAGSLTCGGSSSRSNGACVPGASVACAGPALCAGYQVCSEDGSSLSPCMCTADAHTSDAGDGGADGPGALPGKGTRRRER
jgi:hypothetical protein